MEVARRVAAVESALAGEELDGARAALARLGELAPDHRQLGSLRARLEEAEARAARRTRLAEIAASVREALGREDLDAAGRALEEALALDADDPELRALRVRVDARRAEGEQARRAALERRVAYARARLAAGDLAGAIGEFEGVLAEDQAHDGASQGLGEARTRRAAEEAREATAARQTALDARVVEARLRLTEGDLAGAIQRFEAALRDDPAHAGAERGLDEARNRRTELEAQEAAAARQAALDGRVAEGRLRLSAGDVVGAIERFEAVLAEDEGHTAARRELGEAKKRLEILDGQVAAMARQAALDARVLAGRLRLSAGDMVGAIERLEGVLAEDEGHGEARTALAEARAALAAVEERATAAGRRAVLDARVAEARARLAAGDLLGAIERFEAVLRDDGAHAEAQRGLEDARRERAARDAQDAEAAHRALLDARVAEAQARLAAGDLLGAIERFEAVLRDDGAHGQAQRGLGEARERRAALEARVASAEAQLAADDVLAAIAGFEAVLRDDGAEPAACRGLAEARRRRAVQEARAAEVTTAVDALETALRAPDVDAVQAAFAWVVDLAPAHPQLAVLRDRIAEHRERVQEDREQGAREALAEAGRLLREGQLDPALEALARARGLVPDHPDLPKLERQAQRLVAVREQRVRALLGTAREALERDDAEAAQRVVQEALASDARHPDALALLERVQARAREVAGARRADELASEARRLVEEGKLDEAEARLGELAGAMPDHRALGELPARIEAARRVQAAQVAELTAAADAALAKGDLAAAEAFGGRLQDVAPSHPGIAALRSRIETRRTDPAVIVRSGLDEAARLIREGRPEKVAEVLAKVRAVSPEHPQLVKLESQARKVLEARDMRLRVRELIDRARKLQVKGEFEEGLALAEDAVRLAPDDGRALRLRDDLAEQLEEARRRRHKGKA